MIHRRLPAPLFVFVITYITCIMSSNSYRWTVSRRNRIDKFEDLGEEYFAPAAPTLEEYKRRRLVLYKSRCDLERCSITSNEGLF